ncbi:MAG: hypothetical protein JOZ90_05610 [Alphaproteobacteria bacterium]|nr:hypothetical protein [Alphaproteobacteria bacterium]
MNGPMQRYLILAFAALILVLGGAVIFLLVRGQPAQAPLSIQADTENQANPYAAEMNCIDRLLQRNDLEANEVGLELGNCRGPGAPANQAGAH